MPNDGSSPASPVLPPSGGMTPAQPTAPVDPFDAADVPPSLDTPAAVGDVPSILDASGVHAVSYPTTTSAQLPVDDNLQPPVTDAQAIVEPAPAIPVPQDPAGTLLDKALAYADPAEVIPEAPSPELPAATAEPTESSSQVDSAQTLPDNFDPFAPSTGTNAAGVQATTPVNPEVTPRVEATPPPDLLGQVDNSSTSYQTSYEDPAVLPVAEVSGQPYMPAASEAVFATPEIVDAPVADIATDIPEVSQLLPAPVTPIGGNSGVKRTGGWRMISPAILFPIIGIIVLVLVIAATAVLLNGITDGSPQVQGSPSTDSDNPEGIADDSTAEEVEEDPEEPTGEPLYFYLVAFGENQPGGENNVDELPSGAIPADNLNIDYFIPVLMPDSEIGPNRLKSALERLLTLNVKLYQLTTYENALYLSDGTVSITEGEDGKLTVDIQGTLVGENDLSDVYMKGQIEHTIEASSDNEYEVLLNGSAQEYRCFGDVTGTCQ